MIEKGENNKYQMRIISINKEEKNVEEKFLQDVSAEMLLKISNLEMKSEIENMIKFLDQSEEIIYGCMQETIFEAILNNGSSECKVLEKYGFILKAKVISDIEIGSISLE